MRRGAVVGITINLISVHFHGNYMEIKQGGTPLPNVFTALNEHLRSRKKIAFLSNKNPK